MREFLEDFGVPLLIFVIAGTFLFTLAMCIDKHACKSRWEDSGTSTSWGPIQGCRVQLENGKWIPEDRYREIEN